MIRGGRSDHEPVDVRFANAGLLWDDGTPDEGDDSPRHRFDVVAEMFTLRRERILRADRERRRQRNADARAAYAASEGARRIEEARIRTEWQRGEEAARKERDRRTAAFWAAQPQLRAVFVVRGGVLIGVRTEKVAK